MGNSNNVVLYGSGLFGRNNPSTNQPQLEAIKSSGFTTVILWTLHVWASGDLFYNNTLIVTNGEFTNQYSYLPQLVIDLKSGGTVDKVLFCIGSGGADDFAAIQQLLATKEGKQILEKNLGALTTAMPIDGFDFDLEETPICSFTDTIVQLTLMLNHLFGMEITYCPYYDEQCPPGSALFWENCLAQVYAQNNSKQIVSWYNLQCYSGGSFNQPSQWVDSIKNFPSPLGIDDPAAFVVPGYWCANPGTGCDADPSNGVYCPSGIETQFSSLTKTDPGINGGFIWNSGDLFLCESSGKCNSESLTPAAYAQAIIKGLRGT